MLLVFVGYQTVEKIRRSRLEQLSARSSTALESVLPGNRPVSPATAVSYYSTILAINGASIKDENDAYAFFEKIAEGQKVDIKYRRRNRTRRIELNPI